MLDLSNIPVEPTITIINLDGGEFLDIKSDGKIDTWPENMTCAVFDKLLFDLI